MKIHELEKEEKEPISKRNETIPLICFAHSPKRKRRKKAVNISIPLSYKSLLMYLLPYYNARFKVDVVIIYFIQYTHTYSYI